jgi:hypothetical protein
MKKDDWVQMLCLFLFWMIIFGMVFYIKKEEILAWIFEKFYS